MTIDVEKIAHTLDIYFHIHGDEDTWSIDPQTGKVSSQRNVEDTERMRSLAQLPVQWDVLTHAADFEIQYGSNLVTLAGSPTRVDGNYRVTQTHISDLRGAPSYVGIGMDIVDNQHLRSLEGLPAHIVQWLYLSWQPQLPLLRILLVKGLVDGVTMLDEWRQEMPDISNILNKYRGKGWAAMVPCARELIRAGYKGNAQL